MSLAQSLADFFEGFFVFARKDGAIRSVKPVPVKAGSVTDLPDRLTDLRVRCNMSLCDMSLEN